MHVSPMTTILWLALTFKTRNVREHVLVDECMIEILKGGDEKRVQHQFKDVKYTTSAGEDATL